MTSSDQHDPNAAVPGGNSAGSGEHIPVSTFEVVPYGQTANEQELFSFRQALQPPPEAPVAAKIQPSRPPAAKILISLGILGVAALLAFTAYWLLGRKPVVSYLDLGSQRFDPAGLSGRLIARWDTSGSYQLYLDPTGPAYAANFAAVAADPPRQLSLTLRLLDAQGLITCEKHILFPAPLQGAQDGSAPPAPQGPRQSETGDTVENMTGQSGQIAEIDLKGPLPCPEKTYATFKSWDFTVDFPTATEEAEWQRQEKNGDAKNHARSGVPGVRVTRLPGPMEGDDVIVADNPSRGTVETSGGRVFFLGAGLRNRTAEWQVFPAAIHFHCDKNGSCALTRANSAVAMQARLVK